MRAFLSKPKTAKLTAKGEGNGVRYGVSALQGWRVEMEDAFSCAVSLPFAKKSCFFGVFDDCSGPKAAQYASENLLGSISECYRHSPVEDEISRIECAIHSGFLLLSEKMRNTRICVGDEDHSYMCTAVVALITPDKVIWGSCGASRVFLCRDGKVFFSTEDRTPSKEAERKRIGRAGGAVVDGRVEGSPAVSRALGDFGNKSNAELNRWFLQN